MNGQTSSFLAAQNTLDFSPIDHVFLTSQACHESSALFGALASVCQCLQEKMF